MPGYQFTDEQVKYIIENWGKESVHSMKKKFGCTWDAVAKIAIANKLELPTSNDWTENEIETLVEMSNNCHLSEIAEKLNKTENAVYLKAKRMGITLIQNRRNWTKEEKDFFAEQWGKIAIEKLAKKLKRSVFSLKVRAVRMHLGPMMQSDDLLTVAEIAELLNVSRDRITRWVMLGLKLRSKKLSQSSSIYVITWENLLEFLENNQNEWDSRNVEENILGSEPAWLKEKRKRDKIENPLWYRNWTEEEKRTAILLFGNGNRKCYREIAKLLNRSEWAVANFLRNYGYSYKLSKFWKDSEIEYLKNNYQSMTYQKMAEELGRTEKAVMAKAEKLGYQKKLKKNNM